MVIYEDMLMAKMVGEHLDGNLAVRFCQAYSLDGTLCSSGQVSPQILKLLDVSQLGMRSNGRLVVLPKPLPLTFRPWRPIKRTRVEIVLNRDANG